MYIWYAELSGKQLATLVTRSGRVSAMRPCDAAANRREMPREDTLSQEDRWALYGYHDNGSGLVGRHRDPAGALAVKRAKAAGLQHQGLDSAPFSLFDSDGTPHPYAVKAAPAWFVAWILEPWEGVGPAKNIDEWVVQEHWQHEPQAGRMAWLKHGPSGWVEWKLAQNPRWPNCGDKRCDGLAEARLDQFLVEELDRMCGNGLIADYKPPSDKEGREVGEADFTIWGNSGTVLYVEGKRGGEQLEHHQVSWLRGKAQEPGNIVAAAIGAVGYFELVDWLRANARPV